MQHPIRLLCLSLAFLAWAGPSAAATVFDNQAAYDAAVGPELFFIDFDGSTGGLVSGAVFSSEVAFLSPEAADDTQVLWASDAISDAGSTVDASNVGPLAGFFATPVNAFALVFSSASAQPEVALVDALGAVIDVVTAPSGSGFFGVLSATPIQAFQATGGTFTGGGRDRFFVDDFRANAVPEPVALGLMGVGLAGLAFGGRQRRQA